MQTADGIYFYLILEYEPEKSLGKNTFNSNIIVKEKRKEKHIPNKKECQVYHE